MSAEVPVYSPAGKLLSFAPSEWCERHAPHLRADDGELVAWLEATGRRSSFGCAFEQVLTCGRTWALKGIRGSGR